MITAATFKDFFDRGQFTYGPTPPAIRDKDIEAAITEAAAVFPSGIFPTTEAENQALNYLTAHFLALDTEASNSGGAAVYQQVSRSADGISESVQIPDWMKNGEFSFYGTTYYGQKYLMLVSPYLGGVVMVAGGATRP